MFRVENNVPEVYVQESRDFQLYSRLYDLVFQSARFSIDSMEQVSDTMRCNDKLLPLIADKVGFFTKLNLTTYADRILLSAFPYIIRYKGSLLSIKLVSNVFERIMNVKVDVEVDLEDKSHLIIKFQNYTPNVDLLYALLEYVRPTGVIIEYIVVNDSSKAPTDVFVEDNVTVRCSSDNYMREASVTKQEESATIPMGIADNTYYADLASNVGFTQIVNMENLTKENSDE